ncbi:MAG: SulP family inorganic anion transporter [Alphaproteobacteria bacterium]|nr:SulP family inorganic anion transporter [Alphaproteobacteria bacterium]
MSRFLEAFTPKLVTVLQEGYGFAHLRADIIAGLTVAIVALPLSMAIAIASGASPAQGLITSIVGGFLVSALGGSRHQIGGPAGAFIILVAATMQQHGMDGVLLATFLSGLILILMGLLQIGAFIRYVPYPVTVGFTAGIAVIIFASQIKDLFGLTLHEAEPGPLLDKLALLSASLPSLDPATLAIATCTIVLILMINLVRPHWPALLIAIISMSIIVLILQLSVETIGTRFGGLARSLDWPHLPMFTSQKIKAVLPNAFAFALLGSIESLLSAVVADGMTGRRHRSNCELVAQGIANIGSSLFGGICVTGTIARTATNVRAGAHGPLAGMWHAVFLLLFILIAAPLASYIPLASLAGVLALVAWNMIEKRAFYDLLRASRADAAVVLATFGLTIFRDLTEGIVIGIALGSLVFIHRMAQMARVDRAQSLHGPEQEAAESDQSHIWQEADPNIVVYRISGPFFFGSAAAIGSVLDRISDQHHALILDLTDVPFVDSSSAHVIESLAHKTKRRKARLYLANVSANVKTDLQAQGLTEPLVYYESTIPAAIQYARVLDERR